VEKNNYEYLRKEFRAKQRYNLRIEYPYLFHVRERKTLILRHYVNGEKNFRHFTLTKGRYLMTIFEDKRLKSGFRVYIKEVHSLDDLPQWPSTHLFEEMY